AEAAPRSAAPAARSMVTPAAYTFLRAAAGVLVAVSIGLGAWLSRTAADADAARRERDQFQQRARQAEQSVKALERRLADVPAADTQPTPPRQPAVMPAAVF